MVGKSVARQIEWTAQAVADIRSIDQPAGLRILEAIARYSATGYGEVRRLHGISPPELRLRAGKYRFRFQDFGASIQILTVKHRCEDHS